MHFRTPLVASVTFAILVQAAVAQTTTGRELIRRLQAAPTDAIVQYCNQHAPEADQLLKAGYATYSSNMRTAMDMWIAEKPEKQASLEQEVPSDSVEAKEALATLKNLSDKIPESVKQYDPQKYCPWLAQRLSTTTPESILKSLHQYDARVEAMKQAKKP